MMSVPWDAMRTTLAKPSWTPANRSSWDSIISFSKAFAADNLYVHTEGNAKPKQECSDPEFDVGSHQSGFECLDNPQ